MGVSAVYTPKDFSLDAIMGDLVKVVRRSLARHPGPSNPAGAGQANSATRRTVAAEPL
jgi:(2R)-ethylmalonyl-CoA mutase